VTVADRGGKLYEPTGLDAPQRPERRPVTEIGGDVRTCSVVAVHRPRNLRDDAVRPSLPARNLRRHELN